VRGKRRKRIEKLVARVSEKNKFSMPFYNNK
jgi:hypothetical protein